MDIKRVKAIIFPKSYLASFENLAGRSVMVFSF